MAGRVGLTLRGDLIVDAVEILGHRAVHVEPPVTDEVLLLEQSAVGAEEGVLGASSHSVIGTDVEHLTLGLGVRVVTAIHLVGEYALTSNRKFMFSPAHMECG